MLRADVSTQEQENIKDRCVISRKEKTQPRTDDLSSGQDKSSSRKAESQ